MAAFVKYGRTDENSTEFTDTFFLALEGACVADIFRMLPINS